MGKVRGRKEFEERVKVVIWDEEIYSFIIYVKCIDFIICFIY